MVRFLTKKKYLSLYKAILIVWSFFLKSSLSPVIRNGLDLIKFNQIICFRIPFNQNSTLINRLESNHEFSLILWSSENKIMYKIHKNGPFPFFFLLLKIFEFEICHFIHSSPVNVQDFKFLLHCRSQIQNELMYNCFSLV